MHLSSLELYNFRNFQDLFLNFSPGTNLVVGRNGQGKTNLLEAIYILSSTKSFRGANPKSFPKIGTSEACIKGVVRIGRSTTNLKIIFNEGKKEIYIEERPSVKPVEYLGNLVAITFAPDEIALIKDAPLIRRKFVDKHIVDLKPSFFQVLVEYNRALRNKRELLREESCNTDLLSPWNHILFKLGVEIVRERREFLKAVAEKAQKSLANLSRSDIKLTLSLETNIDRYNSLEELEKLGEREIKQKSCIFGPQRDDMAILLDGKNSKIFASQGESRSIVIALKIGVLELIEEAREETPILLLDDVESELDRRRREALYEMVLEHRAQVFVSGTEPSSFWMDREHRLFEVEGGAVKQVN